MPKWRTVAFDSASELARLYFSKKLGKSSGDFEKIRSMSDYNDVTERLNMLIRRIKNLRDQGTEVVFTAHEDMQKVFAKGSAMSKGNNEPIAIKGWPDLPGSRVPDEFCRAADNVFRVRHVNGKPVAVANREVLGDGGYWEVKDRFNAKAVNGGYLPLDYNEIAVMTQKTPTATWSPSYIWVFYGPFGIGKTRALLTFPRPLLLFDLDRGVKSIEGDVKKLNDETPGSFTISSYDVEDCKEYERFIKEVAACF
jgi:hypothetical protein